jgi:uncharacterized DUF497 family protein
VKIDGIIWLRDVIDKLIIKHQVEAYEVEELLNNKPKIRFLEKGQTNEEHVYLALGQSDAGRYLSVIFIHKQNKKALILSARDMATKERKKHGRK